MEFAATRNADACTNVLYFLHGDRSGLKKPFSATDLSAAVRLNAILHERRQVGMGRDKVKFGKLVSPHDRAAVRDIHSLKAWLTLAVPQSGSLTNERRM